MKKLLSPLAFFALAGAAFTAFADSYEGIAKPWQLGFSPPATPVMERLEGIHDFLLVVITLITLFVLALMIYIAIRFHHRNNPVPSKTAHNTKLEIIWTVVPIFILIIIAIPSLRLHYFMQRDPNPDMTLKVVGYQWYWHYEYPDNGGFGFDSYIKKDNLGPNEHRLLAVDNHVVVPVDTNVKVQLTGADVIHAWAVPAFGVKRDAVPGRLNESWFRATKIGTFYGQCSELCGVGHGFMPIVVDVVSKQDFAAWVKSKQKDAAPAAAPNLPLAKPESAKNKNPAPRIKEEKARSKATGAGKPAVETPPEGRKAEPKEEPLAEPQEQP